MNAKISFRDVSADLLAEGHARSPPSDNVSLDIGGRGVRHRRRPVRLRQEHPAEHGGRPAPLPPRASVLVDGVPVTGPGPERGVIFQQYALFPWLTVRGNVEFGLKLAAVPAPERRRRARPSRPSSWSDSRDFAEALPKTLSGGMKQRCAIARAYAVDPQILLMDEPFGALDALTRVQLQDQLLDTWSRERRTVLFITHDVDEAVYLARPRRRDGGPARPDPPVIDVDLPYPRYRGDPALRRVRRASATRVWNAVYHQTSAVPTA